jgi:Photosynthetic reaction centre cytochrome C subunit
MNVARLKILSAMIVVCSLAATLVRGQASGQAQQAPPQKELMAEDVYKNIQVFRGVPENQFLATMGFFCGSLSESCEFCHKSEATWAAYAEDNDMKNVARRMVLMMNNINRQNFGGKQEVTCYTCHRNLAIPKTTPTFADIYNPNPAPEPFWTSISARSAAYRSSIPSTALSPRAPTKGILPRKAKGAALRSSRRPQRSAPQSCIRLTAI